MGGGVEVALGGRASNPNFEVPSIFESKRKKTEKERKNRTKTKEKRKKNKTGSGWVGGGGGGRGGEEGGSERIRNIQR